MKRCEKGYGKSSKAMGYLRRKTKDNMGFHSVLFVFVLFRVKMKDTDFSTGKESGTRNSYFMYMFRVMLRISLNGGRKELCVFT